MLASAEQTRTARPVHPAVQSTATAEKVEQNGVSLALAALPPLPPAPSAHAPATATATATAISMRKTDRFLKTR